CGAAGAAGRRHARGGRCRAVSAAPRDAPSARGPLATAPIVRKVTSTAFVLFFGPGGESAVEAQLDRIRIAIGTGTLRRAAAAGFAPLIAVTADPAGARAFGDAGAEPIAPRTEPFHFGAELKRIVNERRIDRVCAIGAGA